MVMAVSLFIFQLASVMDTAPALMAMFVINVKIWQQENNVKHACQDIMGIQQMEDSVQVCILSGKNKFFLLRDTIILVKLFFYQLLKYSFGRLNGQSN